MSNRNMNKARIAKNDEFYTRLTDIEKEMAHYTKHFIGKTVFCPCDDPFASQFFQFFAKNFEHLKLKKLITACYKNVDLLQMSKHDNERAIWMEYTGDKNGNRIPDPEEIGIHHFKGDGDFRSEESIQLLRSSDIVVTNPPFSLFREFVDVVMREQKQFIVIGNFNSVCYKNVWGYVMDGKLWVGASPRGMDFDTPSGCKNVNACWFTNVDHAKRHEQIICYRDFDRRRYPKYDNLDAREVARVDQLPSNYKGIMGVPITFLEKWNPDQFEILGMSSNVKGAVPEHLHVSGWGGPKDRPYVDGERKYARILVRHLHPE